MAGSLIGIEPEQAPNALQPAPDPPDLPQRPGSGISASGVSRRNFLLGSATAAAGMAFYSCEIARHETSILTHSIAIVNLPAAFQDYRIVQISDIHFDEFTEPSFLKRMVEHVNALVPDLVLLTGDFISYGPLPLSFAKHAVYRCTDLLRAIACPQRFAVMGNHDTEIGVPIVRDALAQASVPLLVNQYLPIERGGQRLWLSGVDDPASSHPNLHLAIPARPDGPVLLMCHAPDYADHVANHSRGHLVDLMFSGHSHGGQIRMPLLGPVVLPPWGRKYPEGLYRFDRLQLYVNRGLGTVGIPFRLNCPPEITVFTLKNSR
jgi:predicted MPP superfamily phosphohydrolase